MVLVSRIQKARKRSIKSQVAFFTPNLLDPQKMDSRTILPFPGLGGTIPKVLQSWTGDV